jgi:hypothetical protein
VHFITQPAYVRNAEPVYHDPPLLYHLEHDPGEQFDISNDNPEIIAEIQHQMEHHQTNLVAGEDQLASRMETNNP